MKYLLSILTLFVSISVGLVAQPTATDSNQGLQISHNAAQGQVNLDWWGKDDFYFFVRRTSDLASSPWVYFPYAVKGSGAAEGVAVDIGTEKMFFRLEFTDDPRAPILSQDFDNDSIFNVDEIRYGLDLFGGFIDADSNNIPDEWTAVIYGGTMPDDADFDGDLVFDLDEFS